MYGRLRPGRKRRMPDDGFGIGVLVVGVGVHRSALQQITKSPVTEPVLVPRQQIGPQSVHRELQHQPRPRHAVGLALEPDRDHYVCHGKSSQPKKLAPV